MVLASRRRPAVDRTKARDSISPLPKTACVFYVWSRAGIFARVGPPAACLLVRDVTSNHQEHGPAAVVRVDLLSPLVFGSLSLSLARKNGLGESEKRARCHVELLVAALWIKKIISCRPVVAHAVWASDKHPHHQPRRRIQLVHKSVSILELERRRLGIGTVRAWREPCGRRFRGCQRPPVHRRPLFVPISVAAAGLELQYK